MFGEKCIKGSRIQFGTVWHSVIFEFTKNPIQLPAIRVNGYSLQAPALGICQEGITPFYKARRTTGCL
jgi:hypothetical protein